MLLICNWPTRCDYNALITVCSLGDGPAATAMHLGESAKAGSGNAQSSTRSAPSQAWLGLEDFAVPKLILVLGVDAYDA